MIAPVLPMLTDSVEQLDRLLAAVADAGATGATVLPLHLRHGAREWFAAWLRREHPELIDSYRAIYARGSYADRRYRRLVAERVGPLLRRHGLAPRQSRVENVNVDVSEPGPHNDSDTERAVWPTGSMPAGTRAPAAVDEDQLSLL
jgi:DNA repair photolyase